MTILNYITVISAILLTILVLIQTRGASLGAGFGGSAEINTVRRGSDKSIFQITIVVAFIFAASLLLNVVVT